MTGIRNIKKKHMKTAKNNNIYMILNYLIYIDVHDIQTLTFYYPFSRQYKYQLCMYII